MAHEPAFTRRAILHHGVLAALILVVATVSASAPARAQNPDSPCTDGVFMGDVSSYYDQVLADHAANPSTSLYSTLSAEKQAMVSECATRNPGRDVERYTLRQVVRNGEMATDDIIGRVYDYLDPLTTQICEGATCRTGRYYYVAVVLSGCYTDNVFGDTAYAQSVGWGSGSQATGFIRLRQSDKVVARTACTGSPGFSMDPIVVDLTGRPGSFDGAGAIITDADSTQFDEQVRRTETVGSLAFGFQSATSSVWNMLLSPWDVEDNNANGVEERSGSENIWTTPWEGTSTDAAEANLLCDVDDTCSLGYATTWFDSANLWEWQVVYEMRWDVSTCATLDTSQWTLDFDETTHASPSKQNFDLCGSPEYLGALTIVKDTTPEPGDPWADFRFDVTGPTPSSTVLQDPGASECENPNPWAACGTSPPWDRQDRVSYTDMIGSDNDILPGGRYRVIESEGNVELADYDTTWECRNVDPVACSTTVAAAEDDPFALAACAPVQPDAACNPLGFSGGVMSGSGTSTPDFTICMGDHVICKFTNAGAEEVCLESDNAIGDLQVFGSFESENSTFSTGSVPMQSADAADSIFLASFIPLPDTSRWPGKIDHYVLPLPMVENEDGQLVPDTSATCADDDDTRCLAWRAGTEILEQAPTLAEASSDRRIGLNDDQRRVTYTKASTGGVPRAIRRFDWSDADSIDDERDLWLGLGLNFIAEDTASEASARDEGHGIINQTLAIRSATIAAPDEPSGMETLSFVAGDFFHSDPVMVGAPSNFFYLANDLEGNGVDCDDTTTPNRGYRCFFEKNQRRRHVLIAGSNDGQIHGFDAGHYDGEVVAQKLQGQFTLGTGKELFAHLPRPMLGHARAITEEEHAFGIDGGLVVDDAFIDPSHSGTPSANDREWRTLVLGTYREGNRGLFALDVTQPDPVESHEVLNFGGQADLAWVPDVDDDAVPGCANLGGTPTTNCGTLSYPAQLWEFQDKCLAVGSSGESLTSSCDTELWDFDTQCVSSGPTSQPLAAACDEDGNGKSDLGYSWSQVNTGRILVNTGGDDDPVTKFVAIFGGGLDPSDETGIGNWVYMVDVETGEALYKRQVASAVPSEPAAVDTDQDGFIDTLYVGTAGGLLYKVDLSSPADVDATSGRIDDSTQWEPFAVFDTGGRSIFYPPTVSYVASRGQYALAFGTGNREDLFSDAGSEPAGRFYLILDGGFQEGVGVLASGPLTESSYQQIDAVSDAVTGDFLTAPLIGLQPGWVLQLADDERVVTKALTLSGLLVFSTFLPETGEVCEYGGDGRIYALLATNANSIAGADEDRAVTVEGYAGRPVVMPDGMTTTNAEGEEVDAFDSARIDAIRDTLASLFPADCRFGNFSLNVGVTLSNTSMVPVASVPVCIAKKNWTEHF